MRSYACENPLLPQQGLIESELFGYEKSSFSGASATGKRRLVEAAANGTLSYYSFRYRRKKLKDVP